MNTKPFHKRILNYSAREIAETIKCPIPTAYDWKSGRRSPPSWMQKIIIKILSNEAIKHYENTIK
jgi:hypothetical protein